MKIKGMIAILFFSGISLLVLYLIILSLSRNWFYPELFPKPLTFQNWKEVLSVNRELLQGFLISILSGTLVSIIATFAGFITSHHLSKLANRKMWVILAFLPFVMSPLVFAVLLNKLFLFFELAGTITGVMMAQLFIIYPFAFIFFQSFWTKRMTEFENLAATLGTSHSQIILKIHLPLARSWLFVCFFQCFLISWFDYALCNTIGIGKIKTLTAVVFKYIFESNPYYAAIGCLLILLPPVMLLYINTLFVFRKTT